MDELDKARAAIARAYATRDAHIVRLFHEDGWAAERIAEIYSISRARVYQILEEHGRGASEKDSAPTST